LVVLESTTYPGTTEEDLRPVLESGSGLKAGVDFFLAFSPEREDPGNPAYIELAHWAECVVDTRNAMAAYQEKYPGKIWKA
jgi:UDP-N-acetyl-D-mannosaminuronate dehydrogenase